MKPIFSEEISQEPPSTFINDFQAWTTINDSIMGGNSFAKCTTHKNGLELDGYLVEEGGGFVSCSSPLFSPPLDLSSSYGLHVSVDGEGRTLKMALYSDALKFPLKEFLYEGLHWVVEIPTNSLGTTNIKLPFSKFKPTMRAKKIPLPLPINLKAITQIQLLHSKFGCPGELNSGFRSVHIKILLRSINGFN